MYLKTILLSAIFLISNESLTKGVSINKLKLEEFIAMEEKNELATKISNKEICLSYLKKYAEKDLNSIEELFSEDIVLRDWKIRVAGKENALKETRKNFENADSIEIEVLSTYESKDTVAAELKITVDSTEQLYVVDVITINSEGKISSIRAYLGRGDE